MDEISPPVVASPDLISVVIPCYNGAPYLARAIASCLRQTHREIEVIVVDDASPDDCAAIAAAHAKLDGRVRLIRRAENGGVARAFNTGFEAARGEYLTRLAQDDLFGESALATMRARLDEQPEAGLAYCDYATIDDRDNLISEIQVPDPDRALIPRNAMGLCVMWRRVVWETIGGFDPRFDTAEDYEYWLRASAYFPVVRCAGRGLFFARQHHAMGSIRFFERQELATLAALRSALGRRKYGQSIALRKSLACATFGAAHDYSAAGRHAQALARVARSFLHWPWPLRRAEVRTAWARPKSLVVFVGRVLLRSRGLTSTAPARADHG